MFVVGLRNTNWEKRSRFARDYIEWATAVHTLKHSILSPRLGDALAACTPDQDPLADCGLDADGRLADIRDVCKSIDEAADVYDYGVSRSHVRSFLDTLEWSYPYVSRWGPLENATWEAFDIIADNRAALDARFSGDEISLRYDWRTLLAVVRLFLPQREVLVGNTFRVCLCIPLVVTALSQGIVHKYYGVFSDQVYGDRDEWPLDTCFVAGDNIDICSLFVYIYSLTYINK